MEDVYGIILAAGASRRMGQTKALLEWRGETFVGRLRRVLSGYCRGVIVVGAPDSPFPVDAVNPDPDRGMLSSLQCGLEAVPPGAAGALFTLVDLPAIQPSTVEAILHHASPDCFCIPRFQRRRGHPVFIPGKLFAGFMQAGREETPRTVIARHDDLIAYLDVDDAGTVRDADTPAEYQELIANG